MSSFLFKVFGSKTDKEDGADRHRPTPSVSTLLDGKFEVVPSDVSPTADNFPNGGALRSGVTKHEKDRINADRTRLAQLPLNLDTSAVSRTLGTVFEVDADPKYVDGVRLSPQDAFTLLEACAQTIQTHGLETLGIMVPHWYSSSLDVQRRIISIYVRSLTADAPSAVSAFESELRYTRSLHDVASILRWSIRHLKLDNEAFGKDTGWYEQFFAAERAAQYPLRAFSQYLIPALPEAHSRLLITLLDLISSLAAHAEANGMSGSRVTKLFGLWLLTSRRAQHGDDWPAFYARWNEMGRKLEHLFLCRIRDEWAEHPMPRRLTEIVSRYPYGTTAEDALIARPRFSTRQHPALYVRVDTKLAENAEMPPRPHPMDVATDAFRADEIPDVDEWQRLRRRYDQEGGINALFTEDTVRFLTLVPRKQDALKEAATPTPGATNGHTLSRITRAASMSTMSESIAPNTAAESLGLDWAQFSQSGFLESSSFAATLLDTEPKTLKIPEPLRSASPTRRFFKKVAERAQSPQSSSLPPTAVANAASAAAPLQPQPKSASSLPVTIQTVKRIEIDEAFPDFWSDSLLDPIAEDWPIFVVCRLKDATDVQWLVIERSFSRYTPPVPSPPAAELARVTSHISTQSGSPASPMKRRRFNFLTSLSKGTTKSPMTPRNVAPTGANAPHVGEMGELIAASDGAAKKEVREKTKEKTLASKLKALKRLSADATPRSPGDVYKELPAEPSTVAEEKESSAAASGVPVATGATAVVQVAATATNESPSGIVDAKPEGPSVIAGEQAQDAATKDEMRFSDETIKPIAECSEVAASPSLVAHTDVAEAAATEGVVAPVAVELAEIVEPSSESTPEAVVATGPAVEEFRSSQSVVATKTVVPEKVPSVKQPVESSPAADVSSRVVSAQEASIAVADAMESAPSCAPDKILAGDAVEAVHAAVAPELSITDEIPFIPAVVDAPVVKDTPAVEVSAESGLVGEVGSPEPPFQVSSPADAVPAVDATPFEETRAVEETPVIEESSIVKETPIIEAPGTEVTPAIGSSPITEAASTVEEAAPMDQAAAQEIAMSSSAVVEPVSSGALSQPLVR